MPLAYGQFFMLEARAERGATFEQIRARDDAFPLGIIGGNVAAYRDAGFNFLYNLHGAKVYGAVEGLARLSPVDGEDNLAALAREARAPGSYYLGNEDEPDAREPAGLPYMERCGVNVMRSVEPRMARQRAFAPGHLTALMIDRTYAPHNWFVYGQLADLPFNDCYVPTIFHGYDVATVAVTTRALLSAVAPRPPQMMLWTAINTAHTPRVTTPLEIEAQYYYALAAGNKGLHYFIDWSSFPQNSEGGYFIGVTRVPPLFRQLAKGNALARRLAPLLAQAYPWNAASSSTDRLWTGALRSGRDHLLVAAVNRQIAIEPLDKMKFPHTAPTRDAFVTVRLPDDFEPRALLRVDWDGVTAPPFARAGREVILPVDELRGGRFFVLSADADVAKRLQGDAAVMASIAKMQEVLPPPAGEAVAAKARTENALRFAGDDDALTLDFAEPATWEKAAGIRLENASLEKTESGAWALRPGAAEREARAELMFLVDAGGRGLEASLKGRTVSLGYLASLEVELWSAQGNRRLARDTSVKPLWNTGTGPNESLDAAAAPLKDDLYRVIVNIKDPLIVRPDGYSAEAARLTLRLPAP